MNQIFSKYCYNATFAETLLTYKYNSKECPITNKNPGLLMKTKQKAKLLFVKQMEEIDFFPRSHAA